MLSVLAWMGRLAGWLVFLVCAAVALEALLVREWSAQLLFALPAAAGLAFALAADRRILAERRRRKSLRVEAWNGKDISVGLDWFRWLASVGLCGSLAVMGCTLAQASSPGVRWVGIVLAVACAYLLLFHVVHGWDAVRAGHVLKLDAAGIHYFGGETIAWRDVLALDLSTSPVPFVGARWMCSHFLAVSLRPQAAGVRIGRTGMSRLLFRTLVPRDGTLELPLDSAAVDPDLLLQAARVIGARAGVPIGRNWHAGFALGAQHG